MAAPAIEIKGLSKRFRAYRRVQAHSTLKSALVHFVRGLLGRPQLDGNDAFFSVLKDIHLEVPAGTSVAIIGRNGCGKSTLLRLIAGIYRADAGEVTVRGRVASLLELGAGFHPEFSGRENVFINGIILGLSRREIRERFDSIVAFSELADFIDAPVRTYSSGMFLRLAFSVVTHTDPDILLIDEALSVGDAGFQTKCLERLRGLKAAGKTLVLVTHDLGLLPQLVDRAHLLWDGALTPPLDPTEAVALFHQKLAAPEPAPAGA